MKFNSTLVEKIVDQDPEGVLRIDELAIPSGWKTQATNATRVAGSHGVYFEMGFHLGGQESTTWGQVFNQGSGQNSDREFFDTVKEFLEKTLPNHGYKRVMGDMFQRMWHDPRAVEVEGELAYLDKLFRQLLELIPRR